MYNLKHEHKIDLKYSNILVKEIFPVNRINKTEFPSLFVLFHKYIVY